MFLCDSHGASVECWLDDGGPELLIPGHHLVVEVPAGGDNKVTTPPARHLQSQLDLVIELVVPRQLDPSVRLL